MTEDLNAMAVFAAVGELSAEPWGAVRLLMTPVAESCLSGALLAGFLEAHPHVRLDIVLSDEPLDIVAEGAASPRRLPAPGAPVEAGVTPNLAGGVTRGNANAAPPPPARGAVHSAEIEYALGNLPLNRVFAWTPDDYTVSAAMQSYFANFIKTGDPNGPGLPTWPVGTVGAGGDVQRLRIDVEPRAEAEPRARYRFLDRVFTGPQP